jgi:hypothetical protein
VSASALVSPLHGLRERRSADQLCMLTETGLLECGLLELLGTKSGLNWGLARAPHSEPTHHIKHNDELPFPKGAAGYAHPAARVGFFALQDCHRDSVSCRLRVLLEGL